MASSTQSSQHRCVFVGNIPYDATEEQLKQICEEVGPVVHFRLVIDRETGKPKGYGFCEYKDEETALSARRNLQGYEINGRQLRVDFAENDKNTDRNRDQGRGPTGIVSNTDSQRQFVGQSATGDASFYQPMGVSTAIAAATSMAKALGAAQTTNTPNQMGIQSQPLGSDPLTLHLAKMSRIQLNEIMLELKAMATQNKEQARQVLLLHPNLTKAIFQAQFMLGMVTPQMLQMPNILQPAGLPLHPLLPDTRSQQQPQVVPGLPPLPPNTQFTLAKAHDTGGPSLTIPSSSSVQSQNGTLLQFSAYNQAQPLDAQSQILQHGHLPVQSGISTLPSLHHQLPSTLVSRPNPLEGPSSSLNQQIPVPLPQNMGPTISGLKPQITTIVAHPSLADQSLQASGAAKGKQPRDNSHLVARPSKLLRLNDGRATAADVNMNMIAATSGKPANNGIVGNLIPKTESAYDSQKTGGQVQLPPDVESALLQQVMSLTPEQISSLPPDQQQQVIQLQQVLRQST